MAGSLWISFHPVCWQDCSLRNWLYSAPLKSTKPMCPCSARSWGVLRFQKPWDSWTVCVCLSLRQGFHRDRSSSAGECHPGEGAGGIHKWQSWPDWSGGQVFTGRCWSDQTGAEDRCLWEGAEGTRGTEGLAETAVSPLTGGCRIMVGLYHFWVNPPLPCRCHSSLVPPSKTVPLIYEAFDLASLPESTLTRQRARHSLLYFI